MCIGDIMQESQGYNNFDNELDEELTIDLKKIFFALWSRKYLIAKVFVVVLVFFIFLTFISTKKYKVDTDLYINKSNNSNMAELNPYVISELGAGGGMAALMTGGGTLSNDIELMKSPLVIDKVIQENDLRFKKLFGIIPTKKTGQYLTTEKFLKKGITFENKKGTNVVTIEYKNKDRELAYNVVNSIIDNYLELNKEINSTKSKSDKKIIEAEYLKAKADLNSKMKNVNGLPSTAVSGSGGLAALSAISKSAQKALSGIQGQYSSGIKSEISLREDAEKVAELSRKLEWAKLVDQMSESSKVIVLKEPRQLQEYEQDSPKLFTNILLGIVFGIIASLIAVIFKENTDRKLTYSMLGDNVVYNFMDNLTELKMCFLANKDSNIALVAFDDAIEDVKEQYLGKYTIISAEINDEFVNSVKSYDKIILFEKVNSTDSKLYKNIITILKDLNKNILKEVLVK